MAAILKLAPCPNCDSDVSIYGYENGWKQVECDACGYLGPGEGSMVQAARAHNARVALAPDASLKG